MSAPAIQKENFGFSKTIDLPFEAAVEKITAELKEVGFGVLTEIRLDQKFYEKLGVGFRKYVILGACNPALAHKAAQAEINIGLLLPCNVIVYESDEPDKSVVAAVDANAMLSVVGDNPVMKEVAEDANTRLNAALGKL